ncbi:MAG: queuosine precursor transporter [Planctomycetes bacterium]|nr:queuosine precursor transporter [Planctomycetota bacterium]
MSETHTFGERPGAQAPQFTRGQLLYVWLAALFSTSLIMADIVGVKLFRVELFGLPVEHTCGMLTFPLTFLLTDLVNEYYGKRATRRMTFIALAMAVFAFIVLNISQAMPYLPADFNVSEQAFDEVLGSTKLMYVASLIAYLIAQLTDIAVFGFMKRLTGGKLLWLRATGSTVLSQVVDSLIVTTLYFQAKAIATGQPIPMTTVLKLAATGYVLKFVLAVLVTPLIYAGHALFRRGFGLVPLPPDEASGG